MPFEKPCSGCDRPMKFCECEPITQATNGVCVYCGRIDCDGGCNPYDEEIIRRRALEYVDDR